MDEITKEIYIDAHHQITQMEAEIKDRQKKILMWRHVIEKLGEGWFCGYCGSTHGWPPPTMPSTGMPKER